MIRGIVIRNRLEASRKSRDGAKLGTVFSLKIDRDVSQGTDIAMENSLTPYTLYESWRITGKCWGRYYNGIKGTPPSSKDDRR